MSRYYACTYIWRKSDEDQTEIGEPSGRTTLSAGRYQTALYGRVARWTLLLEANDKPPGVWQMAFIGPWEQEENILCPDETRIEVFRVRDDSEDYITLSIAHRSQSCHKF